MSQPLKQCPRTSTVAWCAAEAAPTLLALGSSAGSAASAISGGSGSDATLDFVSFDLARPGTDMDVQASIRTEGGRRFSSISWGTFGIDTGMYPYGIVAGGLQEGVLSLWNPYAIISSKGADSGLIHSGQIHKGTVNCVEFHPLKNNLMATCGADSEVNILNIDKPSQPDLYKPSSTNKHQGSEVLTCAWNRIVPHILCSSSNTGTTVVWDLKQKKEVISFQDPANRLRCSGVAWHPEVPTQLMVCYDDDRQPSMQMWDLRNCQYPFKETAPHTKGVLGVAWNMMDPNLILTCGKDNRIICTSIASGSPETWCDITSQQWNFEVKWAPHKPSLISTASYNGSVSIYSVQQQQTAGNKYCPRWYKKPCGASFGFAGKTLAFGSKKVAAGTPDAAKQTPTSSFCHSLVIPNEPEIVPSADLFEQWIAERKLQQYCADKTRRAGGTASNEGLMWELMGTQFEEDGRTRVPSLLGFDQDRIVQEAERFLGKKPGHMLMGPESQEQEKAAHPSHAAPSLGPELDLTQAESFFEELSATTEQKQREELAREEQRKKEEALGLTALAEASKSTDWSAGPEALIKSSLLVGNLTAAVECCFKSGRMAEALLLASGGGTELWTRARDEYLRLQGDSFLTTVGNIMTNDLKKLVSSSNLAHWMETLAILATYAGSEYQALCEQLAERLEKEKFDIRSAVICYICAKNFPKTVAIWANTHVASQGSQKLALQDLVEKMAVLQEATRFNQADTLFNAKLTQYAEILANSGRLTAAMRYLCLLSDDNSSAILRDRIYNSAPSQMNQLLRGPPRFPFETTDVRVAYQAPQQHAPIGGHGGMGHAGLGHQAQPKHSMPSMPGHGVGNVGMGGGMPGHGVAGPGLGVAPSMPGPGMGPRPMMPQPNPMGVGPGLGGGFGGAPAAPVPAPSAPVHPPGPGMGPAPRMPAGSGLGPAPNVGGGMGGAGLGAPGNLGGGFGQTGAGLGAPAGNLGGGFGQAGGFTPVSNVSAPAPAYPLPPGKSTAPTASAMPVTDGMPVAWPLPTKAMQKLATNQTVAGANMQIQEMSAGGSLVVGEPMAAHDVTHVRNVLTMLLDASSQDGNMKKREDISKRLEDLYQRLQLGHVKTACSQKVLQLVKAVEAQDAAAVSKLQHELCAVDWEQNKNWLMGIKRLIPGR
jgi:protein transport protein SEC31